MKNLKELTILHSNDMHGDFLAEQIDENLVGGVSLLSGYVNMVRRQEKNVLYAIAEIDGMKILFIGIITEDVLAQTKAEELIGSFVDIGEAAQEVGNICNAYNAIDIDFTVLLTHIGFEEDKKLAALLDPAWGVDVIIGGHSHTFLEEPVLVNDIYIVQAGTGTDQIGRFDIMVDTDRNAIDTFTWQLIPINNETCQKDEEMEQFITQYKQETDKKYDRIVTRFTKCLTHPFRNQETALGNLIADILKDSLGVDLMLFGSGEIRGYTLGPVVHYHDLVECLPYDEPVYMLKVTGAQLERMLRFILREEALTGEHTEFYQFSHGMRMVWDRKEHKFHELALDGKPIEEKQLYSIAVSKYQKPKKLQICFDTCFFLPQISLFFNQSGSMAD